MPSPPGAVATASGRWQPATGEVDVMPLPNFADFFHAVRGHAPSLWQVRLAERVAAARRWPGVVVVPSGADALACLDIAVWCLALEAERLGLERELPTRIWWVRDEGCAPQRVASWVGELAGRLAEVVSEPASPTELVAHRLRSLCAEAGAVPLEVIDLGSGGACGMPSDVARPAVILCSLPMYASRLLFRGYGARRPALDAAMAGVDSLVLVDGLGAAERLAGLVAGVGECFPGALVPLPEARRGATVVGVGDSPAGADDDGVRVPEVLAGLVWEWVKTTTPPEGEAPVEPYFGGIGGGGLGSLGASGVDSGSERVRAHSVDRLEALGEAAAVRARGVGEGLGLPSGVCETVALAARFKDIGMADGRFQRAFVNGGEAEEWPRGGRHEALSARLVGGWLEERPEWGEVVERDLLVHLVAAHRGAGRPLVVPVRDGTAGVVCARIAGVDVEVRADLGETDWEQPGRFRRLNLRFGPWGLALLEAIVACSDGGVEDGLLA